MSNHCKPLGKVTLTSRGFELIEFKDLYDEPCSLQKSSLLEPSIWLGCMNNAQPHHITRQIVSPRMHLSRYQVKSLIMHLQNWLKTGSFQACEKGPA